MLKITKPAPNRVDIELSGKLTSETMAEGLDDLIALSEEVRNGAMLYRITEFAMPEMGAIGVEISRLPKLFGLLGKFDRCAVLSDIGWIRKMAEVEGKVFPGFDVKSFELAEVEAAEAWLKTGMA